MFISFVFKFSKSWYLSWVLCPLQPCTALLDVVCIGCQRLTLNSVTYSEKRTGGCSAPHGHARFNANLKSEGWQISLVCLCLADFHCIRCTIFLNGYYNPEDKVIFAILVQLVHGTHLSSALLIGPKLHLKMKLCILISHKYQKHAIQPFDFCMP